MPKRMVNKTGSATVKKRGHTASKYGSNPMYKGHSPEVRELKGKG